ncbi:ABC transporter permease [Halorussus salilacus]|uniref:ABC transporter permease n=1 Tax=Halorussus salilacus TaxID=2953750 RepID=UPI0020A073CE|nr:ABC transporter permease [Halorussus salilacus]USZ66845.1 ABC transporter permease [Halorussus salilacus]
MIVDRLARRFPSLLIARRNLSRTKLRSALAALGIIIGVVAIASLGMFGASLRQSATGSLGDIGSEVIVSPAFESGVEELTERDVRRIDRAASRETVVPVKSKQEPVSYGQDERVVTVYGMENPGAVFGTQSGRLPDRFRSGVVVGSDLADDLELRTGNSVEIGGDTYRVVAILEREGGFSPLNPNRAVVLPESEFESDGYSQVVVSAATGSSANETAIAIRETLNDREKTVDVLELASITDQIGSFFDVLNVFLLGIGSISLLVAGVSILNVMLMSTVERRQEIGVLRAVGFRKRDILKILLAEALLLGIAGGVIGVALSVGVGLVINYITIESALAAFRLENLFYLLAAFVFGVTTSVISGLYPAWKAANERPVEALRN